MRIAFLGFGEAASAFARGLADDFRLEARTFDIKINSGSQRQELLSRCASLGAVCCPSAAEAIAGAEAIFSLVTADQAVTAARSDGAQLTHSPWFFDCNSCPPAAKKTAETDISSAGGRYLDVAVMAPVYPDLHRTPMLISGEFVERAAMYLASIGMSASIVGGDVGLASTIKLIRSVFVKGLEATTAECLLAARRAGVEQSVVSSLVRSHPSIDWQDFPARVFARMRRHGGRRAEEMDGAALTVGELGLPADISSATRSWQQRVGGLGLEGEGDELWELIDRVLAAMGQPDD